MDVSILTKRMGQFTFLGALGDVAHAIILVMYCITNKFGNSLFRTFSKKDHFFGQKISKILCLVFDFICIYYMSSDY